MRNNQVTVSNVERTHGLLSYLWPIQSRSQFILFAPFYVGGLLVVAIVIGALVPKELQALVFLCSALGGLVPLFWNLPGKLAVRTGSAEARHFVNDLSQQLIRFGYAAGVRRGGDLRFVLTTQRWLRWDESELTLAAHGNTIELDGPLLILRALKRYLEEEQGAQHA